MLRSAGHRGQRAAARKRAARRSVPHRHAGAGKEARHERASLTVFKRELASYFATPVAYVFIVIFLDPGRRVSRSISADFFERGQADLQPFFNFHPWLYLFLVPAVGMRLWAEERKSGTIELLLTLPVTMWQAVVGKFLAAWAFIGIALRADVSDLDHGQLSRLARTTA